MDTPFIVSLFISIFFKSEMSNSRHALTNYHARCLFLCLSTRSCTEQEIHLHSFTLIFTQSITIIDRNEFIYLAQSKPFTYILFPFISAIIFTRNTLTVTDMQHHKIAIKSYPYVQWFELIFRNQMILLSRIFNQRYAYVIYAKSFISNQFQSNK